MSVLVRLPGIPGAIVVTPLMNGLRITDKPVQGFAAGVATHGIGTAPLAFHVDPLAGTFAGIAMGLDTLFPAILVPCCCNKCQAH
jgi:putative effector of murein hydrolase